MSDRGEVKRITNTEKVKEEDLKVDGLKNLGLNIQKKT